MNREQKIALIVGFAVILIVGVLVSDHWSRARHLELADATEGDAARFEPLPVAVLDSRPPVPDQRLAGASESEADPEPVPVEPEPFTFVQSPARESGPPSPLQQALEGQPDIGVTAESNGTRSVFDDIIARVNRGFEREIPHAAELQGEQATPAQTPVLPKPAPAETQPLRYTVVKGDSLAKLARRHYGDPNRWPEIADANRGKVGADGSVRAGVTLVIPGAKPPATAPSPVRADPPAKPTLYTVKKNDSLGEIAQRLLGSVRRMDELIAANRDQIDDPDDILAGMVLKIPSNS